MTHPANQHASISDSSFELVFLFLGAVHIDISYSIQR